MLGLNFKFIFNFLGESVLIHLPEQWRPVCEVGRSAGMGSWSEVQGADNAEDAASAVRGWDLGPAAQGLLMLVPNHAKNVHHFFERLESFFPGHPCFKYGLVFRPMSLNVFNGLRKFCKIWGLQSIWFSKNTNFFSHWLLRPTVLTKLCNWIMFSFPFSNKGLSLLEKRVWQLWPGEKSAPKSGKSGSESRLGHFCF